MKIRDKIDKYLSFC